MARERGASAETLASAMAVDRESVARVVQFGLVGVSCPERWGYDR